MSSQEETWLLKEGFGGEKSFAFFTALTKLRAGTPLAYLIGHIPFLNCQIFLDSNPLIPRPETEFWVEKALTDIKETLAKKTLSILDLCAGSGCIGVAVGKNIPQTQVHFLELDKHHLPTIEKNCQKNNLPPSQTKIFSGDLFTPLQNQKYDFILSNPPYIDKNLNRTETSVKTHEPSLALYGGESGLEIIQKIIDQAPKFLHSQGQLWLEHEPEQSKAIISMSEKHFTVTTHKDQYQVVRYSKLVLK